LLADAEGVGEAHGGAAGPQRLLLVGGWRPAGQRNHIEGCSHAPVRIGEPLGIDRSGAQKGAAGKRTAIAFDEHAGGAHGAKIAHEGEHIVVAHDMALEIDHRQGKAGALQQGAGGAELDEGRDARRGAAARFGFGNRQGLAELGQRIAAEEGGEEQPVRFQGIAHLAENAGEVVDPVEGERGHREVEACRREGQGFGIGDDIRRCLGDAIEAEDAIGLTGGGDRGGEQRGGRAEIGGKREGPLHGGEAVEEVVDDAAEQEIGAIDAARQGAPAMAVEQRMVENARRAFGHWPPLWVAIDAPSKQRAMAMPRRAGYDPDMEQEAGDSEVADDVRVRLLSRLAAGVLTAGRAAADLALPPQCLACDAPTGQHGGLCVACWTKLKLIEKPYCARLGVPFAYDLGPNALSAEAIADPPPFDRCRAVAVFDDTARALVHGLKYRDRLDLAAWMAGWMRRAGADLIGEAEVIVPVPLHRRRLWWRRFNQAAALAGALANQTGKPFRPLVLARIRATEQQVGLTHDQRDKNVRGAFRVPIERKAEISGKRVLLVDDVYTTGATVKAATRALVRAGAAAVDVLVFARVVREGGGH